MAQSRAFGTLVWCGFVAFHSLTVETIPLFCLKLFSPLLAFDVLKRVTLPTAGVCLYSFPIVMLIINAEQIAELAGR